MTACGGAPPPRVVAPARGLVVRAREEGPPGDAALPNRASGHGDRIARPERTVVRSRLRRRRARGARRTLPWCRDRHCRPADPKQVHVR